MADQRFMGRASGNTPASGSVKNLMPAELDALLKAKKLQVVDVREPWEYQMGGLAVSR